MNEASKPRLGRVDELDGLRGLLALWVVASHIFCLSGAAAISLPLHFQSAWGDFVYAAPAVETFMILSGFAISFLLHARPQSYAEFMIGRFFRIVPVYFVCLALAVVVALWFTPWLLSHAGWRQCSYFTDDIRPVAASEEMRPGAHLFWHLLLLHGVVPRPLLFGSSTAFLLPAWSISLEWQYYLLAPLIARLVRWNLGVVALVVVALFSFKLGNVFNNPMHAFLPQRLDLFLVGIGSYHLYAAWSTAERRVETWAVRLVTVAFAVALISEIYSVALQIWVIAFGAGFVSGRSAVARGLAGVRAFLLHPVPQYLGRWSYPLYLVHWPLIVLCLCFLVSHFPQVTVAKALPLMLGVALPLAVASAAILHYFVEAPLMRLGRRLTHRKAIPAHHMELKKIS